MNTWYYSHSKTAKKEDTSRSPFSPIRSARELILEENSEAQKPFSSLTALPENCASRFFLRKRWRLMPSMTDFAIR